MTLAIAHPTARDHVEPAVLTIGGRLFPDWQPDYLTGIFDEVTAMFAGQRHDFLPNDLNYHDLAHTLQATLCMAEIFAGYQEANPSEPFTVRQYEIGLTAVLFHDTGYLRTRTDSGGTGAKYTYTHVLRSCALAASLLPRHGCSLREIDTILGAIRTTGPSADISRLYFATATDRTLAGFLVTADYLGQMAAPDYPDKLPALFREFEESDDYLGVPEAKRIFKSEADLMTKTSLFWRKVVVPKLRDDFGEVYRYLAKPYPDGPNPYMAAIERNLVTVQKRAEALSA